MYFFQLYVHQLSTHTSPVDYGSSDGQANIDYPPTLMLSAVNMYMCEDFVVCIGLTRRNSSGYVIANVNFFTTISHVLQNTKKRETTSFNKLDDS